MLRRSPARCPEKGIGPLAWFHELVLRILSCSGPTSLRFCCPSLVYECFSIIGSFSLIAAAKVATSWRLEEKCQSHSIAVEHFFLSAPNLFVITPHQSTSREERRPILYFNLLFIENFFFKIFKTWFSTQLIVKTCVKDQTKC